MNIIRKEHYSTIVYQDSKQDTITFRLIKSQIISFSKTQVIICLNTNNLWILFPYQIQGIVTRSIIHNYNFIVYPCCISLTDLILSITNEAVL